jgi:2-polyprenyl-3-methyl-5-hydroxy-6-metoxy-1,4-benzoquinol methylase
VEMPDNPAVDYDSAQRAFTRIYDEKIWGNGSGASAPAETAPYMSLLADFMKNNEVKSVVDVGCGDWQFGRYMDWSGVDYFGYDVVGSVIDANKEKFEAENIKFNKLNYIHELPPADLVVCKDVLQHLPVTDVAAYLRFFYITTGMLSLPMTAQPSML